jgi:hypothetical protein
VLKVSEPEKKSIAQIAQYEEEKITYSYHSILQYLNISIVQKKDNRD